MSDGVSGDGVAPQKTPVELRDEFVAYIETLPPPVRGKILQMAELFWKFATDSDAGLNAFALVSAELTCMYAGDVIAAAKLAVPEIVEPVPQAKIYVPNFRNKPKFNPPRH